MAETDENFASALDGRSLRQILAKSDETSPLLFVLSELNLNLKASMQHWDEENVANGMAINRMNTLMDTVLNVAFLTNGKGKRHRIEGEVTYISDIFWLFVSVLCFD